MRGADPEYVEELFAGFGPVAVRRMFSGAGVFAQGLMIALVVDGVIFLKADDETAQHFEREGLPPFSYRTKTGLRKIMSYWRMPERLYDDPDELAVWARRSMAVAQRNAARGARPRLKSGAKRKPAKPARKRR